MVAINRGPGVVGWDPASSKPKGVVSPTEHRGGIMALAQRAGVFYTDGADAAISTSTSSRQLTVAPAGVAISSPLGGWYLPWWSSTLTITPAPAGSQARIDVIYAQQQDYELDGTSVDSEAVVDIKQGQPSATPTAPTLDAGQLALYQVRVPAGATASSGFTITRVFQWTAPVGADVVADTLAQLNGISSPSGQRARVIADPTTANNGDYVRSAGVWSGSVCAATFRRSDGATSINNGTTLMRITLGVNNLGVTLAGSGYGDVLMPPPGIYLVSAAVRNNSTSVSNWLRVDVVATGGAVSIGPHQANVAQGSGFGGVQGTFIIDCRAGGGFYIQVISNQESDMRDGAGDIGITRLG